mgnify:CR=1 FL=1
MKMRRYPVIRIKGPARGRGSASFIADYPLPRPSLARAAITGATHDQQPPEAHGQPALPHASLCKA